MKWLSVESTCTRNVMSHGLDSIPGGWGRDLTSDLLIHVEEHIQGIFKVETKQNSKGCQGIEPKWGFGRENVRENDPPFTNSNDSRADTQGVRRVPWSLSQIIYSFKLLITKWLHPFWYLKQGLTGKPWWVWKSIDPPDSASSFEWPLKMSNEQIWKPQQSIETCQRTYSSH